MPPDDPGLLSRLRARDADALRRVVDDNARRLFRAARGMGVPAHEAEDVVQDVLMTFLTTIDRFEGRAAVSTWLYGILHHKVRERRRATARDERVDAIDEQFESRFDADGHWIRPPVSPDRLVASAEVAEALRACLDDLTPLQRDVFHLRQVEELPAAEVGTLLDQSVTHVGVLLHRARLRLRDCLDRKGWRHA